MWRGVLRSDSRLGQAGASRDRVDGGQRRQRAGPFKSNVDYNILFEENGTGAAAQIAALEDTWEWNADSAAAYEEVVEAGGDVSRAPRAFMTMLGDTDMLAYLSMLAPRPALAGELAAMGLL